MSIYKLILELYNKFSKKRKIQLIGIFFLLLISGLSEVLLISCFLTFLNSITNINQLYSSDNIQYINKFFNIDSPNELIIFLGISFIFILILSSAIRIINYKLTFKFSSSIGTEISYKCFKNKLYEPYYTNIEKSSNTFLDLMTGYIPRIIAVIERSLMIIASILISIAVTVSLLVVDFKITTILFFLITISYFFLGKFISKALKQNSKKEINFSSNKLFLMREGISAFREIYINNSQDFFLKSFFKSESKLQNIIAYTKFMSISPKVFLEGISLTIICIIVIYIAIFTGNIDLYIPFFGTLSLASIKLINSIQSIYSSWASILASKEALNEIIKLIDQPDKKKLNSSNRREIKIKDFERIQFFNVSYEYPKTNKLVLEDLNFTLNKGEKIGIVGGTGAGKSTFIDIFSALIFPTNGEIKINKNLGQTESNVKDWHSLISYVSQSIYISERSILENIAYGVDKESIVMDKIKKNCKLLLIDEFLDIEDKEVLNKSLGESGLKISGGQRQRVAIARAIYKEFKILILDEATSALDVLTEKKIINNLLEEFKELTILMITHREGVLDNFDKILKLEDGKLKKIR